MVDHGSCGGVDLECDRVVIDLHVGGTRTEIDPISVASCGDASGVEGGHHVPDEVVTDRDARVACGSGDIDADGVVPRSARLAHIMDVVAIDDQPGVHRTDLDTGNGTTESGGAVLTAANVISLNDR